VYCYPGHGQGHEAAGQGRGQCRLPRTAPWAAGRALLLPVTSRWLLAGIALLGNKLLPAYA